MNNDLSEENVLVELGLGYIPNNETLCQAINIIPPGSVIEFSSSGLRVIASAVIEYGDRFCGLSRAQKFEYLDSLYQRIYKGAIANSLQQTCISLSAGLDSRYALGMLYEHGDRCDAFTFGIQNSHEVFDAGQVAALAGIKSTGFNFQDTSWTGWRRCIEQLGGIGMVQWVGWAEEWLQLLSRDHRYVLIGYLGDALSGKHLIRHDSMQNWHQAWLDWSLDDWARSELLRPEYRARIRPVIDARLREVTANIDTAFPHQIAMHLDLYGRQRRWVASQPNLMARFIHPKTYFLDHELTQFWTNLEFADLDQQRLYKAYARNRFPRFFLGNDGGSSLISRLRNRLERELNKLAGNRSIRVSHVIDRGKIIMQNQEDIRQLVSRTENALGHIIDYGKFGRLLDTLTSTDQATQSGAGLLIRGINLMLLAERR